MPSKKLSIYEAKETGKALENNSSVFSLRFGRALPHGGIGKRKFWKVPVLVRHNSSRHCATVSEHWHIVIAPNATAAANYARDNLAGNIPETEIYAIGPKGGRVQRYIGWETAIGNEIFSRKPVQKKMDLI